MNVCRPVSIQVVECPLPKPLGLKEEEILWGQAGPKSPMGKPTGKTRAGPATEDDRASPKAAFSSLAAPRNQERKGTPSLIPAASVLTGSPEGVSGSSARRHNESPPNINHRTPSRSVPTPVRATERRTQRSDFGRRAGSPGPIHIATTTRK